MYIKLIVEFFLGIMDDMRMIDITSYMSTFIYNIPIYLCMYDYTLFASILC